MLRLLSMGAALALASTALLASALRPCEVRRNFVAAGVRGAAVGRVAVQIGAGAESCIEARVASAGGCPVLHLWDTALRQEVARTSSLCLPFSRTVRLCHRNRERQVRSYLLIAHAASAGGAGTVELLQGGKPLSRALRIGRSELPLQLGPRYTYWVAASPRAPIAATLYALGEDGELLAIADDGGPVGLPRLPGDDRIRTLLLAAEPAPGTLSVYASDPRDDDGDGLGHALEAALGTCDSPAQPTCSKSALAAYYRKVRRGTRDTDRDGLPDAGELLGVAGAAGKPGLDLPRWGADPRHKDVFVEVDRHAPAEHDALSEDDYARVARLFAQGSAAALRNPDGKPGVRLHFDAGLAPARADRAALVGDWGGSNVVALRDYRKARTTDFEPARWGHFRYALLSRQGTGQARRDAFTINRDYHRVPVFAHELAHTLGLSHEGHPSWGKVNCKPGYFSIMNYAYQNREEVGFSRGAGFALDPTRVIEAEGLGTWPAQRLREPPFALEVFAAAHGAAVDWNRDGVISREPIRAALTFATYKSCGASMVARTTLAQDEVAPATPVLARLGARLHALWLDATGQAWTRSGEVSGPDAHGSCPHGDDGKNPCMTFSEAQPVAGLSGVRALAALPAGDAQLWLGYVDGQARVHLAQLALQGSRLAVEHDATIEGARTDDAPALAQLSLEESRYGGSAALGVFFRAADGGGTLMQALAQGARGPWLVRPVRDTAGRPIATAHGPSVLRLGTGELCGAFSDRERSLRFYCYAPVRDAWVDLSDRAFFGGQGPEVGGPVGLAYHRYRTADGAPLGGPVSHGRGALYMTVTEPAPGTRGPPDNPILYVSRSLDAVHGAFAQIDFHVRGTFDSEWTHVAPGTTVTLYEDQSLSALKAVMTDRDAGALRVELLPLADGTFSATLGYGSDFEVMERGICTALRGEALCGDRSTGAY